MAPAIPAIFEPMTTDARTMIGWMPTAPAISRGWRTFIVTNQPMPMMTRTGSTALGTISSATATGGTHETNGPKNGIACSTPASDRRDRRVRQAEHDVHDGGDEAEREAHDELGPEEAAERPGDARRAAGRRAGRPGRYQPEEERADVLAVDRDVDRQDHEDQDVAEHPDARNRDRLERPDQLVRPTAWRFSTIVGRLAHQVHLEAERASRSWSSVRRLVSWSWRFGASWMNCWIEVASDAEAWTRTASSTATIVR